MNFSNANCGTTPCLALRKLAALLLASAALSAGTAGTAAAATYQIIQLPMTPGIEWGHANGINEAGEIVGTLLNDYSRKFAVTWGSAPYALRVLPIATLPGSGLRSKSTEAFRISDAGYIVGKQWLVRADSVPLRWDPGGETVSVLRPPQGVSADDEVKDVNSNGIAVGLRVTAGPNPPFRRTVIWFTPKLSISLQSEGDGFDDNYANAVNDAGTIAGYAIPLGTTVSHAFRRIADGEMQDLGDLPGGEDSSVAYGVNDANQVAGSSTSESGLRAVLWDTDGSPMDLGELPGGGEWDYGASALNDAGVVVGGYNDGEDGGIFVWTAATGMQNIVDLIDPLDPLYPRIASGELQIQINDLNDAGVMVGAAASTSESIPIVLVPQT
jgi:uncharacterized membrane protein